MTFPEKITAVKQAAPAYRIEGSRLALGYRYGVNPYADMCIENALLCDLFPEEIPDPQNFHGFCRSDYLLTALPGM
jgi:hypothetical protein|nr:MAG TPA_asm: hypothetical protein [Caudoviricetes sp.]